MNANQLALPAPDQDPPETAWTPRAELLYDQGQITANQATEDLDKASVPDYEAIPEPAEPIEVPEQPATPQEPREPNKRKLPKANTSRLRAARDMRPDLKPFPYGTKED
jgi:hypothetical protein